MSMHSIVEACRKYVEESKKAKTVQVINRYLIAVDKIYVNYIRNYM